MSETATETAKRIVDEIDTYGDPRLYVLAEEYQRLRVVVDCLLPANGCATVEEALDAFGTPSEDTTRSGVRGPVGEPPRPSSNRAPGTPSEDTG